MTQPTSATLDVRDLRIIGVGVLGLAAAWPALPVHPPLACPLLAITGVPCPLCGMTRAVVAAVHGDLAASLRYNPAGLIVILVIVTLLVTPRLRRVTLAWWLLPAVGLLLWAWNITLNPTF